MLTCCSYRGKHISFQRAKHSIRPNTSLIKIEGVDDTKAATFYNGKRIAYVYRGKKEIRGTKIRVIWGKVTRPHGTFSHTPHTLLEGNGGERLGIKDRTRGKSYEQHR
jgi:ribosomal protein L35AE/L33A